MAGLIECVSLVAILVTVGLHCTGLITCRQIVSEGNVGTIPHLPFLSASLMSGLWTAYGLMVTDYSLIVINIIGAVFQSSYFILYYFYSENLTTLRRDCGITISLFLSVVVYFFIISSPESQSETEPDNQSRGGSNAFALGIVCNIFTILFFASPLAKMSEVIKNKNTAGMSLPLSVMSAAVTSSWSLYGILVGDIFIQVPNMIGFVLSVAQLTLFVVYSTTSGKTALPT